MKLELHVNGYLFKIMRLPAIKTDPELSKIKNIECREKKVREYSRVMEQKYFRQISKVHDWEIFLRVESKMNQWK